VKFIAENEVKYRANVAAILRNPAGRILVCERLGVPGAWQFPQGGIDDSETAEQALGREVWEEIGVTPDRYQVVARRGPYRYLFGNGRMKRGYHGKEQIYFLCDFSGSDSDIRVATAQPEFQAYCWIEPRAFQVRWLPEMKRDVYRAVLSEFFAVKIS
jgi:putative (di)nucleoside polyphosphate hydrolase